MQFSGRLNEHISSTPFSDRNYQRTLLVMLITYELGNYTVNSIHFAFFNIGHEYEYLLSCVSHCYF